MKRLRGVATLLLVGWLFLPPSLNAQQSATLHVNRTDPTCGGLSPCFATIRAAINAAGSGSVIQIQAGTYPEQLTITGKNNFQAASEVDRIIIEADPATQPGQVVLTGVPGACTGNHAIRLQQSKFITIRGLTITNTGGQAISLMGGNNQNQDIHIELNRIFGNGSNSCNGGITVARGNPGTLIVNNLIYSNGRNGITFIDADGGPHYIINNTIVSNQWNGVDVARNHTITLANNIINNNGTTAGTTGGRFGVRREGSTNPQPAGIKLLNNLVCGNTQGQISAQVLDATDASNFTPLGNDGTGVGALPGCELPVNLFADVDGPDDQSNTADDDFSLKEGSLAIDVGMDPRTLGFNPSYNPIFEADFLIEGIRPADGNTDRVSAFDAGAFEFPNGAPVADAGADQTAFRGQLVTLNGTASSDPEGASLTFQWTIISQPTGNSVSLAGASTANPTFTPLVLGEYIIRLVVNDGQLASEPDTVKVTVVNRAPMANAGGPYTGNVNAPIQFAGSGADPDGDTITFFWNFGDGGTAMGSNPTHAYAAGGTYTVTITVTDAFGASTVAQTTATINAAFTLKPIGNKTVNLGQTLTFTVTASNPGGGAVNLYVAPLPLLNHASFNAGTGVFTFRPSTTQVGSYQLTFSATSGSNSASETIAITVPNPPPGGTTSVRGRVVNLAQTPLGNVSVTLKSSGHTTISGTDGFFTITGVPSGTQQLLVNGRQSNLGVYAILAVAAELIDGVLNDLSGVISLPDVDVDTEVQVSPTFNTTVTSPNLPGVELEIIGGSATNPDGTPFTGKLSINPVPDYGRPESRPEELRPGMAVTIQPAGIRFNPPARLTFPNTDNMEPEAQLNLWSLSPDTGKFNIVGKSAVSSDGQSIITVEGGVTASAWHFPLAPSPSAVPNQGNGFCRSCRTEVGSEANLEEGSLFVTHSLPSYRSLGQSRQISLTYSSVTADPKPIVALDSALSASASTPSAFSTRLKIGGVQQGEEIFTDSRSLPRFTASTSRLSHMFDATGLATGRYAYEATVFSNYVNSSIGGIANDQLIIVNRKKSPFGAGWAITEIQQLHLQSSGGVLLTAGDGTAVFFSGGPDTFTPPVDDFSTLVRNADGTYTRSLKNGTKVNFNAQGLQTSLVDKNNNSTTYAYDGNSNLTSVTDSVGLVTTFSYLGGKLQQITDPAGRQTAFQHDSSGNLTRITNPDGTFVSYVYDNSGKLTRATDERGNSTNYSYNFAGRFSQSTRPNGETRDLFSSKLQGLVDIGIGLGTRANPAPIIKSENASAFITDGQGNVTHFILDTFGHVISQTDALGQITTTQRNTNGLPTRISRPNGAVTTMTYDSKGNLLTTTDPLGAVTTFTYEPIFNQVKTIRDPKGNITTINYDVNGNPIEIIDALNNRTQMTYDGRGLLTSVTSAVGTTVQNTTNFTYDAKGNLLTTTDPRSNVMTLAYDSAGNVNRSTDPELRVTQFGYDSMNRLTSVLDADLKTTTYGYDPKGHLIRVTDAKNQITTFTYDQKNRLAAATNPLNLTETFVYDANDNLVSTTNRNDQTIAFNYDALNRLTSKTRPQTSTEAGPHITTFTYDSVGNLTSVANPVTNTFNQYDAANRLISSSSTNEPGATATIQINADTVIGANNRQFEGRTIQVNGRTLTVDGSHTFANLILVNGATLTHSPTTANTLNKLDITVFGSIQIDATSRIDVAARGFLGGNQSGNPFGINSGQFGRGMTVGFQAGSNSRAGGGYGGLGGFNATEGAASNPVYGDFRNPNSVGSGGGSPFNASQGGHGGGLVRIVAQNLNLNGLINANGGNAAQDCCAGGGSGGGVRIDVGTLSGTGQITANGGGATTDGYGGGGGRVAVYYQNATGFDLSRISAFGSVGNGTGIAGGAGTVYLQGPARESGELIVDNNNANSPTLSTPIPNPVSGTIALTHLRVKRGGKIRLDSSLSLTSVLEVSNSSEYISTNQTNANTINITSNSVITHLPTTANTVFKVDLNATTITIDSTSKVDVSTRGFLGGNRPGNPFGINSGQFGRGMTVGFQAGSNSRAGGGYGGLGGFSATEGAASNPVYGDFRNPNNVGSGGGSPFTASQGGHGGGLVRIVAQNLNLNGLINANGGNAAQDCCAGGGSGGGVRIDVGTLSGTGQITANGGGATTDGYGGGGGRVAVYYQNATGFDLSRISAFGSVGNGTGIAGGAGTVYLQGPARESGELIVDNNNANPPTLSTPIPNSASGTIALTHLRVKRGAKIRLDSVLNLTSTLEISSAAEFVSTNRTFADAINLTANSIITHLPTTATTSFKVDLNTETLTIDATSRIEVSARGFLGGAQPGNPFGSSTGIFGRGMTLGFQAGSSSNAGGGYGGLGGAASGATSNPVYGTLTDPNHVGSGGATGFDGSRGGNGGGLVRIVAQTLQLNGSILANGGAGEVAGGGGSGGGVRIDVGILSGTGQVRANGGNGAASGSTGGGGGGRVAIYYQSASGFSFLNVSAVGGTGGPSGGVGGQNGTVHLQQQVAMLVPIGEEVPVMRASIGTEPSQNDPVRLALADSRQELLHASLDFSDRRLFDISILNPRSAILETQQNLYLAMLAEGKIKPFASTSVAVKGRAESKIWSKSANPKSKIENAKSVDDLDPIYTYDLNGNRTSMIDPTGLTTYTYDALNRLTSITNNKGQVTSFTYDALSRRTSMTHANGVVTSYTYDAASQLLTLGHQFGATAINSFAYTYDKVGNRKTKTSRDGLHDYTYDVLNRLTQATNPLPSNRLETYNYDAVGNRTNSNQNGSSVFNSANELNEDANFTYEYDNNGNMIQKTAKIGGGITQYEYDAENKLVRVVSPTNTANYKYDGLGRRVEKEVIAGPTTVSRYVYDNEDILFELDGSNEIVARYTHGAGIDEPLIMEKNNQSFYYHADGLSSITELTNQSGMVIQRYTYSSFGKIESQFDANFVQPYAYTSREVDIETGLYYYRARYYEPNVGRFISQDPKRFGGGINFYSYVDGSPVGRIDPFGLDWSTNLSNYVAGMGDYLSGGYMNTWNFTERVLGRPAIPLSRIMRELLLRSTGSGDIVDYCSGAYTAGEYTGAAIGAGIIWSAGLNGAGSSFPWSGFEQGSKAAAEQYGTTVGKTAIGQLLETMQYTYNLGLPDVVWKAIWSVASATFVGNASGSVNAVIRNAGWIWTHIEKPILIWRNIPINYLP
jgi:RHS repeat-associated protein